MLYGLRMETLRQHRSLPRRAFVFGVTAAVTSAARIALSEAPVRLRASGHVLNKVSAATRTRFFGLVRLYEVALYLPPQTRRVAALKDDQTAKALRVTITYDGALPDDIPGAWERALRPALSDAQWTTLRRAYTNLQPGDEIGITYVPGVGTAVTVGRRTVLNVKGSRLMNAFLDVWVGKTPVSEDVKRDLLAALGPR